MATVPLLHPPGEGLHLWNVYGSSLEEDPPPSLREAELPCWLRLWGTANSTGLTFRSLALEPAFPELGATTKLPDAPFPFTCPRKSGRGGVVRLEAKPPANAKGVQHPTPHVDGGWGGNGLCADVYPTWLGLPGGGVSLIPGEAKQELLLGGRARHSPVPNAQRDFPYCLPSYKHQWPSRAGQSVAPRVPAPYLPDDPSLELPLQGLL